MRIISGTFGGRQFNSPSSAGTHPMSEKVRGGLFNALGDIEGLSVLDAFAGSGALSFEAISRGSKHVSAIEIDRRAHSNILENIRMLQIEKDKIKVIRANCSSWSDNNPDHTYDIVLVAPPYDDLQIKVLQKLTRHVVPNGLYVLDWPGGMVAPEFIGLELANQKNYGDAQLVFYRRNGGDERTALRL